MAANPLTAILEKIASKDKDFRYMATSDLQGELQKDSFKTDDNTEKKLCTVVVTQLEDTSGDISALALKCLGLLVKRVAEVRVGEMLDVLCEKLVNGKKEAQRDIASIALKTSIAEISGGALAHVVVKVVTPKMLQGISSKKDALEIVGACMEIMNETIAKFGGLMRGEHSKLRDALVPALEEPRAGIRKRAIHGLADLSPFLEDQILHSVTDHLVSRLQACVAKQASASAKDKKAIAEGAKTYVQALGAISRTTGYRLGARLGAAVPLILQQCSAAEAGETGDELRELCLAALESFVNRSPHEARQHLPVILPVAKGYLSYDPNFADDMEAEDEEDEDEDDDLSEEAYSDDEDVSWKVRRGAAKVLSVIIIQYPDLLPDLYQELCLELVGRFREREENVKGDVFAAFVDLLRQIADVARRSGADSSAAVGVLAQLQADSDKIIAAAARQLKEKSMKTKIGVFSVLKELVGVLPRAVSSNIGQLLPGIQAGLVDKNPASSGLKIQALLFLRLAMEAADPKDIQPHTQALSSPIFAAVGERYYKVTAEALRVCEQLVRIIRPQQTGALSKQQRALVEPLHDCVLKRLAAMDQDQEVKDSAISCMATVIAYLGDVLPSQTPAALQIILTRLHNDITRLTAVKSFEVIASSKLKLDLSPVLVGTVAELTSFLKKSNRLLRQASITTIQAAILNHGDKVDDKAVRAVVEETSALVSDVDLMITAQSLNLCCALLEVRPACAQTMAQRILPQAMLLVKSPLLQGAALEALQTFFVKFVVCPAGGVSFDQLQSALLTAGCAAGTGKAAQHSVAQCVAVLCKSAGAAKVQSTVVTLLGSLSGRTDELTARLGLLCIGEIGRSADLSGFPQLQSKLVEMLGSPSEETKTAAAQALGAITTGNLATYLPVLLQYVQARAAAPKEQYLFLRALNETIVSLATRAATQETLSKPFQAEVLRLLLASCESEEECRSVVAECLGHLALLDGPGVLPALQAASGTASGNVRTVVATAVKHMVVEAPHPIDALLKDSMPGFLAHISDADRHVRRAAVQTLSTSVHAKPGLVVDQLGGLLPLLYQQTVINKDLIRTVDLGPFKHEIDDGLELRKAAFECMDVLLDTAPARINMADFVTHLLSGLQDHYDVKMPCHLLLAKLAGVAPDHVLAALDQLVGHLEKTLTAKLKVDAVKQEVDRNEDMVRSCLRAIEAISRIPASSSNASFKVFMDRTVCSGNMAAKYAAVREERAEAEGVEAMDT